MITGAIGSWLADFSGSALVFLLDGAIKGTAVLLLALGAARLLKSAPAALRHLLWTLALICLLIVPVLSILVPSWRLPLLPQSAQAVTGKAAATTEISSMAIGMV